MLSDVKYTIAVFGVLAASTGCVCIFYSFNMDAYMDEYIVTAGLIIPTGETDEESFPPRPSTLLYNIGAFLLVVEGGLLLGASVILIRGSGTAAPSAADMPERPTSHKQGTSSSAQSTISLKQQMEKVNTPVKLNISNQSDDDSDSESSSRATAKQETHATTSASCGAILGTLGGTCLMMYSNSLVEPWSFVRPAQVATLFGMAGLALNAPSAALALGTVVWSGLAILCHKRCPHARKPVSGSPSSRMQTGTTSGKIDPGNLSRNERV